jgi:hypothetical protein
MGTSDSHLFLAPQETEVKRITVESQPRKIVLETLSQKYPTGKKTGRVSQGR